MNLTVERAYPVVLGVISALLAFGGSVAMPVPEGYRAGLLSASISASAIFVGFVATSKSILMALPKDGIRQRLHESGYMAELISYLNQAMSGNLAFCVLNVAGFFQAVQEARWFAPLWCGLGVFSVASFWRIGRVMMAILRADTNDS